jgi:hypothetical protein
MRTKLIGLIFAMLLLCVGGALAAASVTVTSSDYCQGSDNIVCTLTKGAMDDSILYVYYKNTTGAWALLHANTTANLTTMTYVLDSTSLSDGTKYFNCTASINSSAGTGYNVSSATLDSCTLDNTKPIVSVTHEWDVVKTGSPQVIDCSQSTDATAGISSYSMVLKRPNGESNTSTTTPSNGEETYYSDDLVEISMEDEYVAYCTVEDLAGNSNISSTAFSVSSSAAKKAEKLAAAAAPAVAKSNTMRNVFIIVIVIIVFSCLVAFAIHEDKKKRKR